MLLGYLKGAGQKYLRIDKNDLTLNECAPPHDRLHFEYLNIRVWYVCGEMIENMFLPI